MAGPLDPFNPGTDTTPFGGVDPQTFDKVRGEWDSFLSNPQGRAALLSMGLQMMQPPSFGDNRMSQIGRAIGAGGETATANEAMDLKKSEAESKDELRQVRGQAALQNAESRAGAAEARAGAAGARNEATLARIEQAKQGHQLKILTSYYQDMAKLRTANQNAKLLGQPEQPVPSLQDWVAKGGHLTAGIGGGIPEDDLLVPPGADTTSQPGLPVAKPNDPNRRPGRYQTPKGPMTWDGTGWVQ